MEKILKKDQRHEIWGSQITHLNMPSVYQEYQQGYSSIAKFSDFSASVWNGYINLAVSHTPFVFFCSEVVGTSSCPANSASHCCLPRLAWRPSEGGYCIQYYIVPILWLPDIKSWLIGKGPDAGKDWRQEEKGASEDETVGWHHQLNRYEFEQTPGDSEGQGSLVCCSPWGGKESDTTEWLNNKLYSSGPDQPNPCPGCFVVVVVCFRIVVFLSLLNLSQHCFCFMFRCFGQAAGGILALRAGTEQPLALEGNGPPGKSLCPVLMAILWVGMKWS